MKTNLTQKRFDQLCRNVCKVFGISVEDLLSHYRPEHVVRARLTLYHLLRSYDAEQSARYCGKTRSTLVHGRRRLWGWIQVDADLAGKVRKAIEDDSNPTDA